MLICRLFGHSIQWFYYTLASELQEGENLISVGACNRCGSPFVSTESIKFTQ